MVSSTLVTPSASASICRPCHSQAMHFLPTAVAHSISSQLLPNETFLTLLALIGLQAVMELLSDAVPNVRLVALGLLPALKQTIRLPEDVQQLVRMLAFVHHFVAIKAVTAFSSLVLRLQHCTALPEGQLDCY